MENVPHLFVFQLGLPLPPTTPEITTLEHTTPQRKPEIAWILGEALIKAYISISIIIISLLVPLQADY